MRIKKIKRIKKRIKAVAKQRIQELIKLAEKSIQEHPKRSNRYVEIANKIRLKYKIRVPGFKRTRCKKCGAYLYPDKTLRIRLHRKRLIYTCKNCGNIIRLPIDSKQKTTRS